MIPEDTPAGRDNCGIAAVAMLAGVTYKEAERLFMDLCGKCETTTVWDRHEVMEFMGLDVMEEKHYRSKPTLSKWYQDTYVPSSDYHVTITGHVIAMRRGLLFDQVFRRGIHPNRSPYKRKQVTSYHRIKPP